MKKLRRYNLNECGRIWAICMNLVGAKTSKQGVKINS